MGTWPCRSNPSGGLRGRIRIQETASLLLDSPSSPFAGGIILFLLHEASGTGRGRAELLFAWGCLAGMEGGGGGRGEEAAATGTPEAAGRWLLRWPSDVATSRLRRTSRDRAGRALAGCTCLAAVTALPRRSHSCWAGQASGPPLPGCAFTRGCSGSGADRFLLGLLPLSRRLGHV